MSVTYSGPLGHDSAFPLDWNAGGSGCQADTDVEQAVRSVLADMPASETAYITVAARSGVVTLTGTVSDSPWLARFKNRLTSAMPGITIDDRLEWVLPDCGIGVA